MNWKHFCIVLLATAYQSNGFKQVLKLITESGQEVPFIKNTDDLTFVGDMSSIVKYCSLGAWDIFEGVNYTFHRGPLGSMIEKDFHCANVSMKGIKSLRHWGAEDTYTDALSLYAQFFRGGKEILVTDQVALDIDMQVGSVASTGTSSWTLFSGKKLDGRSICFRTATFKGYASYLTWMNVLNRNKQLGYTVGSVFKGCNAKAIKAYKQANSIQ